MDARSGIGFVPDVARTDHAENDQSTRGVVHFDRAATVTMLNHPASIGRIAGIYSAHREAVNGRAALDEVDNAAAVFAGKGSVRAKCASRNGGRVCVLW